MAAASRVVPLPTLFLAHGGGPCFFMQGGMFKDMDAESPAANFLRQLPHALSDMPQPTALVVISAHWEGPSDQVAVQSGKAPPLLFDYYGFPAESYEIKWPAPGSPQLAERVKDLLSSAGFRSVLDGQRGYDHGVFVPLKLAYPDAAIPTIQVSLHASLDFPRHIALGRALAPLRREGALIIGSGFTVHNLRDIARVPGAPPLPWAQEFDAWLAATLLGPAAAAARSPATLQPVEGTRGAAMTFEGVAAALARAPRDAPHFACAHPRVEHLLPLLVALGAADPRALLPGGGDPDIAAPDDVRATEMFSQLVMGSAAFSSYRFDSAGSAAT